MLNEPTERDVRATKLAAARLETTVYDLVMDLRRDVASLEFPLDIAGAAAARERKDLLLAQLDDYLLPRLAQLATPAIVVVAGSTGVGKSTIVNSLVGKEVTKASILRPTTREPVLVYHPDDDSLLAHNPLRAEVRAVADPSVPRGIVLLDAPDLDSIRDENRQVAKRLLEAADLWLFVTTSQRYGDALPWHTVTSAVERGTSVAMVLNRAPRTSLATVRADLLDRLRAHDLGAIPLFVIEDQGPHEGVLGRAIMAPIKSWLQSLAGTDNASTIIVTTLKGALTALPPRVSELVSATEEQFGAAEHMKEVARTALTEVYTAAQADVVAGDLAKGPISARWSALDSSLKLGKFVGRNGFARGNARAAGMRSAALAELSEDAMMVVSTYLHGMRNRSRAAMHAAVADAPGGELVPALFAARTELDHEFAKAWHLRLADLVNQAGAQAGQQGTRSVAAVGEPGLVAIVAAAVLGLEPATNLTRALLGNAGTALVAQEVTHLSHSISAQIEDEQFAFVAAINSLGIRKGSELSTRVRLAELRRLR